MSIRPIDLRAAALREYPEFGEMPPPVPWYAIFLLLLSPVLCVCYIALFIVVFVLR